MDMVKLLLTKVLQEQDLTPVLERGLNAEMLPTADDQAALNFILDFKAAHGAIPSIQLFESQFPNLMLPGYAPDPGSFYAQKVAEQAVRNSAVDAILSKSKELARGADPFDTLSLLTDQFTGLSKYGSVGREEDVRDGVEDRIDAYIKRKEMGGLIGIRTPWQSLDTITQGWQPEMYFGVGARPKMGKAQPLNSMVLTTSGFKRMGDISVGDQLASVDGSESEVTGVFPQGVRPVFRLTFADGRTAEASDEHLWEVFYRGWGAPRVVTTKRIVELLSKKRYQKRLSIRMFSGEFGSDDEVTMDPYVLGVLIGDGCFRAKGLMLSSADSEVVEAVGHGTGLNVTHYSGYDYSVCNTKGQLNPATEQLRAFGLWGLYSHEKFIPEAYMTASSEARWALLRGLMDTDGTAEKSGATTFCTTSRRLAEQVVSLVRSLGGRAQFSVKKTSGKDAYVVGITPKRPERMFSLPRKRDRVVGRGKLGAGRLVIDSVEYIGDEEVQCISVSHESHLYVTDNYVVTHNTWFMLWIAYVAYLHGSNVLFFNKEVATGIMNRRLDAIRFKLPYKDFKEGLLTDAEEKRYFDGLRKWKTEKRKNWFIFYHGATTTAELRAKVDDLAPDLIIVDGAYLLLPMGKFTSDHAKEKNISRELKAISQETKIPLGMSIQLNRGGDQKQRTTKNGVAPITLADIAGSDAYAQDVDVFLALERTPDMKAADEMQVLPLAVREDEGDPFTIRWGFSPVHTEDLGPSTRMVEEEDEDDSFLDFEG
jgi:replicative DNA helicase